MPRTTPDSREDDMTGTKRAAARRAALAMADAHKRPAAKVELIATVALALSTAFHDQQARKSVLRYPAHPSHALDHRS
jgi:hypothetical protein